jgi:CHAT domain-containing protein
MLSLDAKLRYIPFAALYDGKNYLVERYQTVLYSESAMPRMEETPTLKWTVNGLGVAGKIPGFAQLREVCAELHGIVDEPQQSGSAEAASACSRSSDNGQSRSTGILPGHIFIDQSFTKIRLEESLDQSVPVLHIATHFVFRPGTEENSFLLLGDGSKLSLLDLHSSGFDFQNLDLLTLSACDTAVGGGKNANGNEVEGFASLALKQHAAAVLATLWSVEDESTSALMRDFYRSRQYPTAITKAGALQQAQLAIMTGKATGSETTRASIVANNESIESQFKYQRDFSHPYYWAPFILIGNWL